MARDVAAIIGEDGWITRKALLDQVSRGTVANWLALGTLVRIDQGAYAVPAAASLWRTRLAAALRIRERAVASHSTALALWDLVERPPGALHLTVGPSSSARGTPGVVLHRSAGAYEERVRVDALAVTTAERSLVETWGRPGSLRREQVRAAAITAVRRRLCRPREIEWELARRPRLAGHAELEHLVGLLVDGCESELEIWGCLQVLRAPGMPPFVQQRRISVAGQTFFLDAAYDDVQLAVEMDGASWHGSRQHRERDIRRDALLATIGWQTLRFSFARLTIAPDSCRRDILAARAARQGLFRADGVR
jgi:very-short-patch-repair endonuclease/predicted transcriptional regulator of viral defense system